MLRGWKVDMWVSGLARASYEAGWAGPRKLVEGVWWYHYSDFVCRTWLEIETRVAQVSTNGLYARMKMEIEEVEMTPRGEHVTPVDHI